MASLRLQIAESSNGGSRRAGLTDERINMRFSFENFQGQIWELSLGEMMQHVVNHSTYHRGQVVTMLRQLGQAPPSTDLSLFLVRDRLPKADPKSAL